MVHDDKLIDILSSFEAQEFSGTVYRATRSGLDPLAFSSRGGRWTPKNEYSVLYTSLAREVALSELSFHFSRLTPLPSKPISLHTIELTCQKTLRLVRADLTKLGVDDNSYDSLNYAKTQEIGAAVAFLEYDGLIVPSARCTGDNLVVMANGAPPADMFSVVDEEQVNWQQWARDNYFID